MRVQTVDDSFIYPSHSPKHVNKSRLLKEVDYYKKEVIENQEKLKEMQDSNRDFYDIKKFKEVLDESLMMVPDSERRLKQALDDLHDTVSSTSVRGEWFETAQEILTNNYTDSQDDAVKTTKLDDLGEDEAF